MVQPQMKRVWVLVLVGLFAGAGVLGYFLVQGRGSTPKYRVARVERGPLTAVVAANGTLNSVVSVQVGTQVSGQIQRSEERRVGKGGRSGWGGGSCERRE